MPRKYKDRSPESENWPQCHTQCVAFVKKMFKYSWRWFLQPKNFDISTLCGNASIHDMPGSG